MELNIDFWHQMSLHAFSLYDSCKFLPLRGAICTISPADISLSIGPSCSIFGCSINISHVMELTASQANNWLHGGPAIVMG